MLRASLESKTPASLEHKIINDRVNFDQSTHNGTISNSVGMALLYLANEFFTGLTETEIEAECDRALSAIEKLSSLTPEEKKPLTIDESAIASILIEAKEGLKLFDTLTLFLFDEKTNSYEEKVVHFHIKKVVALVWLGLNNDSKFMHHYAGTAEEKLLAAKKDKAKRLESFYNCLKEIKQVCHQGKRNALVRLLNKTYQGIEFIEDDITTIMDFTKESIDHIFFEKFEHAAPDVKKELSKQYLFWMESGDASPLLKLIDKDESILASLKKLFLSHGTNPLHVEKNFYSIIQCLTFSYDHKKRGPLLGWINHLIQEDIQPTSAGRSLTFMKKWLRHSCELDNKDHHQKVAVFYCFYHANKSLTRHKIILSATALLGKYETLETAAKNYFENFLKTNDEKSEIKSSPADKIDFTIIQELNADVEKAKRQNCHDLIENFFYHFYQAKSELNASDDAKEKYIHLHEMLLDKEFQKKIFVDDKFIEHLQKDNAEKEEIKGKECLVVNINPYEVNRIILHAIMTRYQDWTLAFRQLAKDVYALITDRERSNIRIENLKRDSYPAELLVQLNYFIERSEGKLSTTPAAMILLPNSVESAEQMFQLLLFWRHDAHKIPSFYNENSANLIPCTIDLLIRISDFYNFKEIIELFHRADFLKHFLEKIDADALRQITRHGERLVAVLELYNEPLSLFEKLGSDHLRYVLQTFGTMNEVLSICKKHPIKLTLRLMELLGIEHIKSMFHNGYTLSLTSLLAYINEQDRMAVLNHLSLPFLKDIFSRGDNKVLYQVFKLIPKNHKKEFVDFIGIESLIRFGDEAMLIEVIPLIRNKEKFLKERFGYEHLRRMITSAHGLEIILSHIPLRDVTPFLKSMEDTIVKKNIIKNIDELKIIFNFIDWDYRLTFMKHLTRIPFTFFNLDTLGKTLNSILNNLFEKDVKEFLFSLKEIKSISIDKIYHCLFDLSPKYHALFLEATQLPATQTTELLAKFHKESKESKTTLLARHSLLKKAETSTSMVLDYDAKPIPR